MDDIPSDIPGLRASSARMQQRIDGYLQANPLKSGLFAAKVDALAGALAARGKLPHGRPGSQ